MKNPVNTITNILAGVLAVTTAIATLIPEIQKSINTNPDGSVNWLLTGSAVIVAIVLYFVKGKEKK